jgi:oxygen-independent coproporphyrinogen-3 oxidase
LTNDPLTRTEQADEFLLMGLRLAEGIDIKRFERLTGFSLPADPIAHLERHGLVETTTGGRLRATPAGFPVLNAIVTELAA